MVLQWKVSLNIDEVQQDLLLIVHHLNKNLSLSSSEYHPLINISSQNEFVDLANVNHEFFVELIHQVYRFEFIDRLVQKYQAMK
jgi:hypothetical protein